MICSAEDENCGADACELCGPAFSARSVPGYTEADSIGSVRTVWEACAHGQIYLPPMARARFPL
jgi:hypothetical protein